MRICLTIVFSLFYCVWLNAQFQENAPFFKGYQSQYSIYHWTTSNGLPQSHVSGITQTRNKLLWISTYNGIVSYDGKRFMSDPLLMKKNDLSSFITSIHAVGDSVIWTSTKEIVVYYNQKIVAKMPYPEQNLFIPAIRTINNKVYFFSQHNSFELNGKKLKKSFEFNDHKQLKGHTLLACVYLDQKFIYLTRNDSKNLLVEVDSNSGKVKITDPKASILNIVVANNKLLLQSKNAWYEATPKLTLGKLIKKSTNYKEGALFQSGISNQLEYYYDGLTLEITNGNETRLLNVESYMQGNELFSTYVDHTGNLWVGTNSNGLFMFRHYPFYYPSIDQHLRINNSSHSFVDSKDVVWFDNECKETFGIDLATKKITNQINAVCSWANLEWSADSLALFGFGGEHSWYNRKTNKRTQLLGIDFPINYCFAIKDRDIILGAEGALYKWDGKVAKRWKVFKNEKTTCNQIVQLQGRIYFATSEGVYCYSNNSWSLLVDSRKHENADFRSLFIHKPSGNILIGTAGNGIMLFNYITGKIKKLAVVPHQLRDCWSIVLDQYGQLWISSNNGIAELELDDLLRSFELQKNVFLLNHYRFETGIENVEFNSRTPNKGYLMKNGNVLFSSLAGPVVITPVNNAHFNSVLANIIVKQIEVNGIMRDALSKKLVLTEGDYVHLQFTLPTFSQERVLQFEYRIKGYRDEWRSLVNPQVTLDNLPSGSYILEIRLTSEKRSFSIPVEVNEKYPGYWIIYLILSLIGIILIIFITARTTRYIQYRKNQAFNLRQKLKIMEIEALRAQMNPHFTFNCLNTIQFLFMSGNIVRANKYLSDFSSLMRLTLELMPSSLSTLDVEMKITQLYINLEQLQFDDGFEFRLQNNIKTQQSQIKAPTMFLQLFVENAILHGLKNVVDTKPVLTLTMDETENEYIFKVSDNGPGYAPTTIGNHKSVGLKILRERFELKSELYNWNIDFKIDQIDEVINDIRTTVTITFGKTLNEPF